MDPNWRLNNNEVGTKKTLKCVLRDRENQLLRNRRNDADKEKNCRATKFRCFRLRLRRSFSRWKQNEGSQLHRSLFEVLRGSISSVDLLFSCKRERDRKRKQWPRKSVFLTLKTPQRFFCESFFFRACARNFELRFEPFRYRWPDRKEDKKKSLEKEQKVEQREK